MNRHRDIGSAALLATLAASLMSAHQVAAKATREALFLSSFHSRSLPLLMMGAALLAIVLALFVSRAMAAVGPGRLVPAAFATSAAFHFAEWALASHFPRLIAVAFYLHFASLGAIAISGFWSLLSERFDPHTARQRIAQITSGGAAGALAGGGVAMAVGREFGAAAMLPLLACLHVVCAWMLGTLRRSGDEQPSDSTVPAQNRALRENAVDAPDC